MPAPDQARRRDPRIVTLLVALTAIHGGYRLAAGQPHVDRAVVVSTLELGTELPVLTIDLASVAGWTPSTLSSRAACQVVVAFDPSCPYCLRAANEETRRSSEARLPTTWVAPGDSIHAIRYRDYVGKGTRVAKSTEVWSQLEVQAVPAAFLVDAFGVVRHVWPYRGVEEREELKARCSPRSRP